MPTYHFNVSDHLGGTSPDWMGTELADIAAVKREALRFAGETLIDASARNRCIEGWRVEVTDHTGEMILSLGFALDFKADEAPKADRLASIRRRYRTTVL